MEFIETRVFAKKRFVVDKMLVFGFQRYGNVLIYEDDLLGGDFHAVVSVSEQGVVQGKLMDNMNDEEYVQLRQADFQGPYIHAVRTAYTMFLSKIAEQCCDDVLFVSEQANRISDFIAEQYDVVADFPWRHPRYLSYGVFRHPDSGKWFALIMDIKKKYLLKNKDESKIDVINVKIHPEDSKRLIQNDGIYPAYHMNHQNWISVMLDERLTDRVICTLISESFDLT